MPNSTATAPSKTKGNKIKSTSGDGSDLSPFLAKQKLHLLALKDSLLDSVSNVSRDALRVNAGAESSAFGQHMADAGSDAYDRDFALSMLSNSHDSLYEIDSALKRIADGSYGICEISQKPIGKPRLEALPFTRYTVECQAELEKNNHGRFARQQPSPLFGFESSDGEEEETDKDDK